MFKLFIISTTIWLGQAKLTMTTTTISTGPVPYNGRDCIRNASVCRDGGSNCCTSHKYAKCNAPYSDVVYQGENCTDTDIYRWGKDKSHPVAAGDWGGGLYFCCKPVAISLLACKHDHTKCHDGENDCCAPPPFITGGNGSEYLDAFCKDGYIISWAPDVSKDWPEGTECFAPAKLGKYYCCAPPTTSTSSTTTASTTKSTTIASTTKSTTTASTTRSTTIASTTKSTTIASTTKSTTTASTTTASTTKSTTTASTTKSTTTASTSRSTETVTEVVDTSTTHMNAANAGVSKNTAAAVSAGSSVVSLVLTLWNSQDWLEAYIKLLKSKKAGNVTKVVMKSTSADATATQVDQFKSKVELHKLLSSRQTLARFQTLNPNSRSPPSSVFPQTENTPGIELSSVTLNNNTLESGGINSFFPDAPLYNNLLAVPTSNLGVSSLGPDYPNVSGGYIEDASISEEDDEVHS